MDKLENTKFVYDYPKVDVITTIIAVSKFGQVLLGKISSKAELSPNRWRLPAGFIRANEETVEECCIRSFYEDTGIKLKLEDITPINISSDPHSDSRGHIVNVVYMAMVESLLTLVPGNAITELNWMKIGEAVNKDLAGDHKQILKNFREISKSMVFASEV